MKPFRLLILIKTRVLECQVTNLSEQSMQNMKNSVYIFTLSIRHPSYMCGTETFIHISDNQIVQVFVWSIRLTNYGEIRYVV